MKNIIFVAPPAAGKGTVSNYLTEKYGYIHISTGDLLRDARNNNDEMAKTITELMDSGKLVSDEIVLELLKRKIDTMDKSKQFILDGFPRNIAQASTLDDLFKEINVNDYIVIYLDIDFDEALKRTLGRITCPKCKKGYHKYSTELKPKIEGICDVCGTELITRSDDTEETFKIRFDNYVSETKPVLDYYKDKNKLITFNANQNINDIYNSVEGVI